MVRAWNVPICDVPWAPLASSRAASANGRFARDCRIGVQPCRKSAPRFSRATRTILAWGFTLFVLLVGPLARAQTKDSEPTIAQLEARVSGGDSLDAETQFRLGRLYEFAKRYDDEERAFRTAIAADPRYAPAYFWLGYIPYLRHPKLWKQQWAGKTPQDLEKPVNDAASLRLQAFLIDPLVGFRAVGASPIPEQIISIPEYSGYEKATTYVLGWLGPRAYLVGAYEMAFSAMDMYKDRRYQNQPDDSIPVWVLFYHGLSAAHLNQLDQGIADFEALVRRADKREHPDTLVRYIETAMESDSLMNFPLVPNDFRYALAFLKERRNRPVDAIKLYQDAITRDLSLYMAHARLAQLYRQYKILDKATTEAQAAVDANPDDASLQIDLAAVFTDAGRLPEAEATLKHAQTIDPRLPLVSYNLGLVEQQLAHSADARTAFTRFLAIAPSRLSTQVADAKQRLASLQ